ncbi:hypothetical protein [Anaerorhabdus sp.]|uniref:hypothetical protein n=1 Tax=Anaerorhabdus sp. TaxID=1872524 RepID=UPI002FCCB70C
MKKLLFILLSVLLISGCSTSSNGPERLLKEKAKYTPVEVNDIFTAKGYSSAEQDSFIMMVPEKSSYPIIFFIDSSDVKGFTIQGSDYMAAISTQKNYISSISNTSCSFNFDSNKYEGENGKCDQSGIDSVNSAVEEFETWLTDIDLNYNDLKNYISN